MAKVMYSGKMVSDQIDAYLTNGVAETDLHDGDLVALGNLVADTTYVATGDVQYDLYAAAYPAAATDEVVIIDYAGISEGEINGNEYKIGKKLYNLTVPAGTNFRVRRLALHDKFWLGEGNFASEPTVGQFAKATAAAGTLTPAADKPASGLAVKVQAVKDLTTGMKAQGKIYLVEVVQL
jgi:hypothetical protein